MSIAPRVVVVTRPTQYEELVAHHATRNQAAFFLKQRQQNLDEVELAHHRMKAAISEIQAAIPTEWRRNLVSRQDLDRFLFEPEDTIVVVGQDGLVPNIAKYLDGQPVLGVNPTPELFDGILVRHTPQEAARRLVATVQGAFTAEARTLVEVELDDGQTLCALNELFVGQKTHQSARYELSFAGRTATHSSSGIIVSTGTGSSGWAHSIHLERHSKLRLPKPTDGRLAFFVREAFPSVATTIDLTEGTITKNKPMVVVSRMDDGVIFGDGIEADFLCFDWGRTAKLGVAKKKLQLVV